MAPKKFTVSEGEQIELEYKQLQIEELREKIEARRLQREHLELRRNQSIEDFKKNEEIRLRKQRSCKHRKGGKDNKFSNGNSQNYSVIQNTYPNGEECVMCTRCGKDVWKPSLKLRKTDPKLYQQLWMEWETWRDFPTDNTPSGGKIFEIIPAA